MKSFKHFLKKNIYWTAINSSYFLITYNLFKKIQTFIFVKNLLGFFYVNLWYPLLLPRLNNSKFLNNSPFSNLKLTLKKNTYLVSDFNFIYCYFFSLPHYYKFFFLTSFFNFRSIISTKSKYLSLGYKDSLQILGYARKSYFSKIKNLIYFKVGNSFINKFIIPSKLLVILNKRRLLTLYTFSLRLLVNYSYKFFFLKEADPYKGYGIRLNSKKLVLKEIFVKKR